MLYIDDIGKDPLSEIKTGKADFSAQIHGDNLLGISFPFNNISKQVGALHLSFPFSDPTGPEFSVDASNADKDKGRVLKFTLNNINARLFRCNATADIVNRSLSLLFPCSLSYNLEKYLPLRFDGSFRIDFWAVPLPKKPNKLAEAAVALEEQAKKFEEQRKKENPSEENNDNNNDTDEIDFNDDKNLNLSLDFLHDKNQQKYTYCNTFGINSAFSFEFMDYAAIKLKIGAESKIVEPEDSENSENPAQNEILIEEEEEALEDDNENNRQQVPPTENVPNDTVKTVFAYKASIEGNIAQVINFLFASDDEISTHEISFPIPYSNFRFGLCTSILNGHKALNTFGTSLVYNAEDGLTRLGFAYDVEFGKDYDSKSWNLGGGVFKTQFSQIIHADFHKDEKPNMTKLNWGKKDSSSNNGSIWSTYFNRFRQYIKSFRHNLRDVDTFYLGSSLKFNLKDDPNTNLFSEGSLGVTCNLPESIGKNAQFQVLTKVSQIEDEMTQKSPMYDYSLATRYSWMIHDKTNLSLYTKVSTSSFIPSLGIKLVYKD